MIYGVIIISQTESIYTKVPYALDKVPNGKVPP
jgi:hypothetical protein